MSKEQMLGNLKNEEMYIRAESKSSSLGMKGVLIVGFGVWLCNSMTGNDSKSILLVMLTGITVSYWVKYRMLKEKGDLIWFIAGVVAWVGAFGAYVLSIIR